MVEHVIGNVPSTDSELLRGREQDAPETGADEDAGKARMGTTHTGLSQDPL